MTWEQVEVVLKRATVVLGFVIGLGGAATVLIGLWRWAGPLAAVALAFCILGAFVALTVPRMVHAITALHHRFELLEKGQAETRAFLGYHFSPNGHEDQWPELRDKPMREMFGEVWKRFADGGRWMRDHEQLHEEQQNRGTR